MSFIIFNYVFRSSKSLKTILNKKPFSVKDKNMWFYLHGILSTSFFGFVIYKENADVLFNSESFKTKKK